MHFKKEIHEIKSIFKIRNFSGFGLLVQLKKITKNGKLYKEKLLVKFVL